MQAQINASIGVIGLGIMGGLMARELITAGHQVFGYDIDPAALKAFECHGGRVAQDARSVASQANILILSLPSAAACLAVAAHIAPACAESVIGKIIVETSTLSIEEKVTFAGCFDTRQTRVLDCPILGTANQTGDKNWTIYMSGPSDACEKVSRLLGIFSDDTPYVGTYGAATKLKLLANHLVAIYNVAYAETLSLAKKSALDPEVVARLLGQSRLLATGVMHNRMPMMVKQQYVPATMKIETWQKDMRTIKALALAVGSPTPLLDACAPIYTAAMQLGLGSQDTAAVAEVFSTEANTSAEADPNAPFLKPRVSTY